MKNILITFILILSALTVSAQVKVLGKIEPNGPTDTYPTHVDSLGKGGLMAVGSWQERNAIPLARRKAGMLVRVKSAMVDSTYTLNIGLTNTNWTPFVSGGSSDPTKANLAGGNFFTGVQKLDGNDSYLLVQGTEAISFVSTGQIVSQNIDDGGMFLAQPGLVQVFSEDGSYIEINPKDRTIGAFSCVLDLPYKSGTLATTSDIPKMLVVSATSTGSITYSFAHGLSYTPTMVVVTANSDGATVNGYKSAPLTSSAKINGANIDITIYGTSVAFGENVGPEVGAELKWTIMVK